MYYVDYDGLSYLAILENAKTIGVKKQNNGDYIISASFIGDAYAHEICKLTPAQIEDIVGEDRPTPDNIMYELISRSIYEAINKSDLLRILKVRYDKYCKRAPKDKTE